MCNTDDLPPPPPVPSTPVMTHQMSSLALSINASGLPGNQTGTNATVVPSTPQIGNSSTMATPADCAKGSINIPVGTIIVLAVVLQLAFKLM